MKYTQKDILKIVFLDHCHHTGESPEEPIEFEVYGRFVAEDKVKITLACWLETDGKLDNNSELFTIVKGAIVSIRRLS